MARYLKSCSDGIFTQETLEETEVKEEEVVEETEGITLVDDRNGFNKLSLLAMLWTVRHRLFSGEIFALNCYFHEALLVVLRTAALCHIMTSRKWVTQGDPLSMVLYVLSLFPLDEAMRAADPGVLQPWYADDAAIRITARNNSKLLRAFMEKGPYRG